MTIFRFKVINNLDGVTLANCHHAHTQPNEFQIMHLLKNHREKIDEIDTQIAELLGKRFRIAEEVAEIKRKNNIPVRIQRRIDQVLKNAEENEKINKLPPRLGYFLWQEIIEATCYHEEKILGYSHDNDDGA